MLYAILATDRPGSLADRLAARPAHLERLHALQEEGRLVLAGPHPAIDKTSKITRQPREQQLKKKQNWNLPHKQPLSILARKYTMQFVLPATWPMGQVFQECIHLLPIRSL